MKGNWILFRKEMSSLKGQLSLRLFSDQSASILGVYSCLKSLPWNYKRKNKHVVDRKHNVVLSQDISNVLSVCGLCSN